MTLKNVLRTVALCSALTTTYSLSAQPVARPIADCGLADFVEAGDTTIAFAGAAFTPKCLKVKVGTTVTIPASQRHPLAALAAIEGVANIIATQTPATAPIAVTFTEPGYFGYFCEVHGSPDGSGMAGVIQVVGY